MHNVFHNERRCATSLKRQVGLILAASLFLLGTLLCYAQSPMLPGFPPGVFQNRGALDAGGGSPPPTLVTSAKSGVGGNNTNTLSLTTATGNFCVFFVSVNLIIAADTMSISDGVNTWTFKANQVGGTNPGSGGVGADYMYLFYATALSSATLTETMTVSPGATVNYSEMSAACFSGVNATPFDGNASNPDLGNATPGAITTNKANSVIVTAYRTTGNPTGCDVTLTQIQLGSFAVTCYGSYTSIQTALAIPAPGGTTSNGSISVAINGP